MTAPTEDRKRTAEELFTSGPDSDPEDARSRRVKVDPADLSWVVPAPPSANPAATPVDPTAAATAAPTAALDLPSAADTEPTPEQPPSNPERRMVLYTGPGAAAPAEPETARADREPTSPYQDFFTGLERSDNVDLLDMLGTVGTFMQERRQNIGFPEADQNPELDSSQLRSLFAANVALTDNNTPFRIAGHSWRLQPGSSYIQCGDGQTKPPEAYADLHVEIRNNAGDARLRALVQHFGFNWGDVVTDAQIAELINAYLRADLRDPAVARLVRRSDPESIALRDLSFRAALELAETHRAQNPGVGGRPYNGAVLNRLTLAHVAQGRAPMSDAFSRNPNVALFLGAPPNGGAARMKNPHDPAPGVVAARQRQQSVVPDDTAGAMRQAVLGVQPGAPAAPAPLPTAEQVEAARQRRIAEDKRRTDEIADELDQVLADLLELPAEERIRKIGGWSQGTNQSYPVKVKKRIGELAKTGVDVKAARRKLKAFNDAVADLGQAGLSPRRGNV